MTLDLKTKIIRTADDLFHKQGVRATSIDDICHKLGISKKTFYQVYEQKEDLVSDIVANQISKGKEYFEKNIAGKSPIATFYGVFKSVSRRDLLLTEPRMSAEIEKYYPDTFNKNKSFRNAMLKDFFENLYRQGVEEGVFRSDIDKNATLVLIGLMLGGVVMYLGDDTPHKGRKVSFKAIMSSFEQIFMRSMLTDKGIEEYNALKAAENKE